MENISKMWIEGRFVKQNVNISTRMKKSKIRFWFATSVQRISLPFPNNSTMLRLFVSLLMWFGFPWKEFADWEIIGDGDGRG